MAAYECQGKEVGLMHLTAVSWCSLSSRQGFHSLFSKEYKSVGEREYQAEWPGNLPLVIDATHITSGHVGWTATG